MDPHLIKMSLLVNKPMKNCLILLLYLFRLCCVCVCVCSCFPHTLASGRRGDCEQVPETPQTRVFFCVQLLQPRVGFQMGPLLECVSHRVCWDVSPQHRHTWVLPDMSVWLFMQEVCVCVCVCVWGWKSNITFLVCFYSPRSIISPVNLALTPQTNFWSGIFTDKTSRLLRRRRDDTSGPHSRWLFHEPHKLWGPSAAILKTNLPAPGTVCSL